MLRKGIDRLEDNAGSVIGGKTVKRGGTFHLQSGVGGEGEEEESGQGGEGVARSVGCRTTQ